MKKNSVETLCRCGSGRAYDRCCGRWHGGEPAPDAESLMRSRYSAFVMGNAPYLLATWHATRRPRSVSFDPRQKWLGLKIIEFRQTGEGAAEVEFIARYRIGGGAAARLHERSRFLNEGGRWLYLDGDIRGK